MKKFDIPEIPHELVLKARRMQHDVWDLKDLDLNNPPINLTWDDPGWHSDGLFHEPKRMVEDPEYDLAVQLKGARRRVEMLEAGSTGPGSIPSLNLIHFGTGPIATAFGAKAVLQTGIQPHFEPAVHTPEEVLRLEKPDLIRGGMLGAILDRIAFFNEATQGRLPITISDNAGPWNIASSVWHYEDMLEAIHTCPEAVHHLLRLVTEAIMEVNERQIQYTRNAWRCVGDTCGNGCLARGAAIGDDVMVTVSTPMWKEFFLPYNEIISRRYGGLVYHCCMRHDWQLKAMSETHGFMGCDPDPYWNDPALIADALTGKGVWNRLTTEAKYARLGKGKFGLFLGAHGRTKEEAVENAKKLLDETHRVN